MHNINKFKDTQRERESSYFYFFQMTDAKTICQLQEHSDIKSQISFVAKCKMCEA